jgi:hypothetical protein
MARLLVLIFAGKELGQRKELNPPSYLSFCPCSALRRWLHTTSMKPATRLEHEQKSGVIPVDFIISEALISGKHG